MKIVAHRVNTIAELLKVPQEYGLEIDLRAYGSEIILTHEPYLKGELFKDFLKHCAGRFLILNIKEAGIEDDVIKMAEAAKVNDYFLLDVEFPYIFKSIRSGFKKIAARFSEIESIETLSNLTGKVDWVWIDTVTQLPVNEANKNILSKFKTCLVCPERWGRPEEIGKYKEQLKKLCFNVDAVMTHRNHFKEWES